MTVDNIWRRFSSHCAAAAVFTALLGTGVFAQEPPKFSGFLGDYSQLQAANDPAFVYHYRYVEPRVDWKTYDGVLIDSVKVYLKADAGYNPHDVEVVAAYFEQALLRELGGDYPVRQEPRPGLLRLRIAITGLAPTEAREAKAVDFLPLMLIARAAKGRSINVKVGSIAIEGELIDAATGKRLAALASKKRGNGVDDEGQRPAKWEEVEEAMDFYAKRLRAFFDSARAPADAR